MTAEEKAIARGSTLGIAMVLTLIATYTTHVVTCIQQSEWLLLIAGCIVPFVGWINGFGEWFGWWL